MSCWGLRVLPSISVYLCGSPPSRGKQLIRGTLPSRGEHNSSSEGVFYESPARTLGLDSLQQYQERGLSPIAGKEASTLFRLDSGYVWRGTKARIVNVVSGHQTVSQDSCGGLFLVLPLTHCLTLGKSLRAEFSQEATGFGCPT